MVLVGEIEVVSPTQVWTGARPSGRWHRGRSTGLVRGVGGDLPIDHREVGGQLLELGADPSLVAPEQFDSAGAVAVCAHPFYEGAHILDWHSGATQSDHDVQQ